MKKMSAESINLFKYLTTNILKVNAERWYNMHSGWVPDPSLRNTRIPPVRGQQTLHYARAEHNLKERGKKATLEFLNKDETKFFERRIKHMSKWMGRCKSLDLVK